MPQANANLNAKQVQPALLKTQKLEAQKVAQSGQPHVGEGAIAPIVHQAAESTPLLTGEALSSPENLESTEIKPSVPEASFNSEPRSASSLIDVEPKKSFEGYYK